jgi:acid phosphatase type 7
MKTLASANLAIRLAVHRVRIAIARRIYRHQVAASPKLPADLPQSPSAIPRMTLDEIDRARHGDPLERHDDHIVFHVNGDTGGGMPRPFLWPLAQRAVAKRMRDDCRGRAVSFFYHLGDVVYRRGELARYRFQFDWPYRTYRPPLVGVPGNHDAGESREGVLAGFVDAFCVPGDGYTPVANKPARARLQPHVYWTLTTPRFWIIGLCTNTPEGGVVDPQQRAWFIEELAAAGTTPVIIALHHPPYSNDYVHGSSHAMRALLDECTTEAGKWPVLVLSGHAHSYQRYHRDLDAGRGIGYVVAGGGGHILLEAVDYDLRNPRGTCLEDHPGVRLRHVRDDRHGFLRLEVLAEDPQHNGAATIHGAYLTVPHLPRLGRSARPSDQFVIDATSGILLDDEPPARSG